jgi:sialidase-1
MRKYAELVKPVPYFIFFSGLLCLAISTRATGSHPQVKDRAHNIRCNKYRNNPAIDTWKGFQRVRFKIGDREAWYVKPSIPLKGNPWIWRASFPDWHTEMDSLLLAKGFYVAYISVDNQYGSPYAMQVWDQFYHHLVDSLSFSPRVALEAVSRGGLYAYGWAKRNPDKVTCIYAEAPVCAIQSWPGGKGKGQGDSASWKQFKEVFQLNEAGALAFADNPIDQLEGLASFKVPMLHIISNKDQVVPPDENTYILTERYSKLGGPVTIYPVTDGPQELNGHHFPIQIAGEAAGWIIKNSYPVKKLLSYKDYFTKRNGLSYAFNAFAFTKKATVAFLGGSITYNPGWRNKTVAYLRERFPSTDFHFIAAGIPSLGSLPHAFRLQRDVLDSGKVDLLFIETAVNDRGNGTDSITQVRSLEGIVRHAKRSNPSMDIILMSFADPSKTRDYDQGKIPVEIENHERLAGHYGLPSINLAKEIHDKLDNKEFSWEYDFKDLHPSPFGQELYFATIKELLNTCFGNSSPQKTTVLPPALNNADFTNGEYYGIENAKFDIDWILDPNWTPKDSLPTREGFVNRRMLITDKPGASLSLSFKGTAVGMAIVSGADAGTISYSLDKGEFKKIDLYTPWSSMLHLPWYILFGADLKNTSHTLRLRVDDEKNSKSIGNACRIVYFLVNR